MSISGDGLKSNVRGTEGNDDIRATTDTDGSNLQSGFGDDILRGGRFDDWLTGGAGNDQLFGGDGADQFRFFGGSSNDRTASREIEGSSDTDFIRDLDFVEGDSIVLNGFGVGKFVEAAGANALDNGNSVIITSYAGLRAIDDASDAISITRLSNGNLIVSIMDSEGAFQNISITGGVAGYDASAPTV